MRATCGRCGQVGTDATIRPKVVDMAREAQRDGRPYDGPDYDHGYRCLDKAACDQRARIARGVDV